MGLGGILQRLKTEGVLALYHDYSSGTFKDFSGNGHDCVGASMAFIKKGIMETAAAAAITVTSSALLEGTQGAILVRFKKSLDSMFVLAKSSGGSYQFRLAVDNSQVAFRDSGLAPWKNMITPSVGDLTLGINFATGGTPVGYKNGIFVSNFTGAISITPNNGMLEIGNDDVFSGTVGNMLRYLVWVTRPLTAAEHQELYQQLQALS
jgi:hypothetical protein